MRVIIQRVSSSEVSIDDVVYSQINQGLLILLGIATEDTQSDIDWMIQKILNLRIFYDDNGKMNLSILEIKGHIQVVSQFTLFASTKKGNRPSFIDSARPEVAIPLYEMFVQQLKLSHLNVQTGVFGANMQIKLTNDGPVTIIIDSKNRE